LRLVQSSLPKNHQLSKTVQLTSRSLGYLLAEMGTHRREGTILSSCAEAP
jgi:hypothetical protein